MRTAAALALLLTASVPPGSGQAIICPFDMTYNPSSGRCESDGRNDPAFASPAIQTIDGTSLILQVPSDGFVGVQVGGRPNGIRRLAGIDEKTIARSLALGFSLGHDPHSVGPAASADSIPCCLVQLACGSVEQHHANPCTQPSSPTPCRTSPELRQMPTHRQQHSASNTAPVADHQLHSIS